MTTIDCSSWSTDTAERIAQELLDDNEFDAALVVAREHGESIYVADDGNAEVAYPECATGAEAAREYVEDGDWGDAERRTFWIDIKVWQRYRLGSVSLDDETSEEWHKIERDPDEPDCPHGGHEWCSPHAVVGGIESNPGVRGHGAGVYIREVCKHCGLFKLTDTWAQDMSDGSQGHTSVEYDDGAEDGYQEAWLAWKDKNDE